MTDTPDTCAKTRVMNGSTVVSKWYLSPVVGIRWARNLVTNLETNLEVSFETNLETNLETN